VHGATRLGRRGTSPHCGAAGAATLPGPRRIGRVARTVAECACGQPDLVVGRRGEEPRSQLNAIGKTASPAFGTRPPQLDRLTSEGETACPTGLGRTEHIGRDASLDRQHAPIEVVEAQRHQLAPPGAGVRGQADEQPDLLGLVPTLGVLWRSGGNERVGGCEQAEQLLGAEMEPGAWTLGPTHARKWVDVDDALDMCPADSRAKHAEAPRDYGHRGPSRAPCRHGRPHVLGLERPHPAHRQRVHTQGLDVRARPDPGSRPPIVLRAQPAREQIADGEERGGPADGTAFGPFGGELLAPELGVFDVATEGERPLHRTPRDRVEADRDADLPDARTALAHGALFPPHVPKVGTNVGIARGSLVRARSCL